MGSKIDLTGQKYNRLTVIKSAGYKYNSFGNRIYLWECLCDCGNIHITSTNDLRQGRVKSCGCQKIESCHIGWNKKQNEYEIKDSYAIGKTRDDKTEFYVDLEDLERIKPYCWYKHHSGYIMANDETHHKIMLHKLIMNDLDNEFCIDHIRTENKNDCRKSNLRKVTRSQNNQNRKSNNPGRSGVTGVQWHSRDNCWIAVINYDGKPHEILRTKDLDEAIKARHDAEDKYYGDYSYRASQKIADEKEKQYGKVWKED